tara:strand:+ start:621 stop:782 length:162 start_codon:yes stop_codon:yes gene_type:complete
MNNINESNISIWITASIAANKSFYLATSYKESYKAQVVMTKLAKMFTRNCATS